MASQMNARGTVFQAVSIASCDRPETGNMRDISEGYGRYRGYIREGISVGGVCVNTTSNELQMADRQEAVIDGERKSQSQVMGIMILIQIQKQI